MDCAIEIFIENSFGLLNDSANPSDLKFSDDFSVGNTLFNLPAAIS